ncbi:hypothetical protein V6Z12_D04G031500 [Gossypium hirsutum]
MNDDVQDTPAVIPAQQLEAISAPILRNLMVMKGGIQLSTIVVVGDQSSGKSSVLESLVGINLPRVQGICTRASAPEFSLEFNGRTVSTDEEDIANAIVEATNEIAGQGKGISNNPLTLVVKKNIVPDLTMVDLPGFTRVPVHGQPENIYEQIRDIIMDYIKPEESIIVNVLSASVDFSTCESIRIPGNKAVSITSSFVGIPVLAQKLVQIQATIISKCSPEIVRKITEKLNHIISELKKMPMCSSSPAEAMTGFIQIIGAAQESMQKILVNGEFEEYLDEKRMHCTARLAEMLNNFSDDLQKGSQYNLSFSTNFLMDEILVLEEAKVREISSKPVVFMSEVWGYSEDVVINVLMNHSENYPKLQASSKRAIHNLTLKMKEASKREKLNRSISLAKESKDY